MYAIPSSPMPPNSFAANDVDESTDENSMAGLAKRVSAYLARVVGALADFEDQLLCEAGFFAREEHLEKHIHLLLREFESNRRAAVLFSRSDAVGLLIAQLVANPQVGSAGPDLHSRRQQQFVFAASVLLTSTTILTTLREQPPLLERLWAFLARPAPLDPAQLQYWCRVAGILLLNSPSAAVGGHTPNTGSPNSPDQHSVARLLPRLLRHVYSDAICWLIKCLLGLPIGSPSQQGEGEVNHANLGMPPLGTVSPLSLRTAITGEHALLSPCVDVLLEGGEGASNAADLLCTLCETLPERTDAVELMRSFVPSVTPLLPRVYDAALALDGPKTTSDARIAALKLTSATLRLETRCSGLADEGLSWLPVELLQPDVSDHAVSADSPFARLLAPRLAALRERLLHSKSLQQVQTAELLATLLSTAPKSLHEPIAQSGLIEAAASLFLKNDANGGGRQDFVRHLILKGFKAALSAENGSPTLHKALVLSSGLPKMMLRALAAQGSQPVAASSREYIVLLHNELSSAADKEPTLGSLLSQCGSSWLDLKAAIMQGSVPSLEAVESPLSSSPVSPMPPIARPAELVKEDAFEGEIHIEEIVDENEEDEGVVFISDSHDEADTAPLLPGPVTAAVDAENIDPNSPPSSPSPSKRMRGTKPAGAGGSGTPRPATRLAAAQNDPASPFEKSSAIGMASLLPPPPPASPPPPSKTNTTANPGTPRPDAANHPGTPRPEKEQLRFVEESTLRTSEDFSCDTPQPKVVRKEYLTRRAKENFGNDTPGKTPAVVKEVHVEKAADNTATEASPSKLPRRNPSRAKKIPPAPAPIVGFDSCKREAASPSKGAAAVPAENDSPQRGAGGNEEEDSSVKELRSSVRSLCF